MAEAVMGGGKIARKISGGARASTGIAVPRQMESRLLHSQGGGHPMPTGLQSTMERGFGLAFPQVRIHTDADAAAMSDSIGAKAFTYGNDIFFNQGRFQPESSEGQHLIAHELTHAVQQTGKVAREEEEKVVPKDPRNIRVSDQEKDEVQLSESLSKVLDGYMVKSKTIRVHPPSKPPVLDQTMISSMPPRKVEIYNRWMGEYLDYLKEQLPGPPFISDVILPDCMALIEIARNATGVTKQQLVQQLYNTLSQVSVALDILPKPGITSLESLRDTSWMQCRKQFVTAVQSLASIAKNPAIAVLMYEGTYYPKEFSDKTLNATNRLFDEDGSDPADLYYYGAVCNNAAYGSVRASGAPFFNDAKPIEKLTINSDRTTRDSWGNYNPQGTGLGDGSNGKNALDGAKQGDIVVFWKLDKIRNWDNSAESKTKRMRILAEDSTEVTTHGTTKEKQGDGYTAHHIEVIVGVQGTGNDTKVLLSGAHYQAVVNGFARNNDGSLAWKTAKEVRGKDGIKIIRRIPMNNEQGLIPVDIPSIMANQKYSKGTSRSSYTVDGKKVPIYIPRNASDLVRITWLTKNGAGTEKSQILQPADSSAEGVTAD